MKIRSISTYKADLPLAQPFQHASSGLIDHLEQVVVKIETAEGVAGYSEVRGNAPYVTGESQGKVIAALRDILIPRVLTAEGGSLADYGRFLDRIVPGNTTAKAAIDIALHDAAAKVLGVSVQTLLGAGSRPSIPIHGTLPFCAPEEAARRTRSYLDRGIRKVKVRVGLEPFQADLDRMEAVRAAIRSHPAGAGAVMAVDANQAWQPREAIRKLRQLRDYDLAWAEQPVAAADFAGLKEVRDAVDILIVADESCGTPEDVLRLANGRVADAFHFKLCKAGGIRKLMAMVAIAEAAGLRYMIGQMDEGMLATAAGLHCAAASAPFSCELWGFQRVGRQPFSGLVMENGAVAFPPGPGLGIIVDEAGLVLAGRFEAPA